MLANRISITVLWLTIIKTIMSAMVAQDKVIEMIQQAQHQLPDLSNLQSELRVLENQQVLELALPLSLLFGVMDVTDSTSRDMSLPKWQAMLRALGGDREILKRFAQLRPRFNELENQVGQQQDGQQEINQILDELAEIDTPTNNSWSRLWLQLKSSVQVVSNLYDWFDRYQRNAAVVNERTLRDYAETVHGQDGLTTSQAIEAIHKVVCPLDIGAGNDDGGMNLETNSNNFKTCSSGAFEVLEMALAEANDAFICSTSKSPHQLVYDLYTLLALTDAKGYAMMQFSWMLLGLYGKGNYTTESDMARVNFEHQVIGKARAASRVLSHLSTWIWKCDPSSAKHVENETYIQFTELLQGYIVNEVDLNQDNTCKESCSAYTNSQEKGCFDKKFCSVSRRCLSGRVYNCGFVEADSTVCSTNATGRRYDWVEYKSGRTFGKKSECSSSTGNSMHRVDSWWRWLFWHCSYCTCLCDQPGLNSDRYISLESSTTDTNYLVTGVRFVKRNRIVHIQIQEGEALPKGMVNKSTIRWQAIRPMTIPKYKEDSFEDGTGYATLRYEERAFDLDDLVAPTGHVITGIRFRKLGGHLNLEIQACPTNFETGHVDSERATWISNDNTPAAEINPRKKMSLFSPDVPTRSTNPSVPDSHADSYIEFQASSLEKDLSQTTIPFLDATPVAPNPPTWLTGIGIYHKSQPGYGGFLAFRLSTFNMSDHFAISSHDSSFHGVGVEK